MTGAVEVERDGTTYRIRPFETADAEGFLALFEAVWPDRARYRDVDWLRWKYVESPAVDSPRVFLVETGGEVVAVRPYVGFELAADEDRGLGLLAADTAVHPDHRGLGLFTSMTEASVEAYTGEDPAFVFNYPNAASLPGYEKVGWRRAGRVDRWFRIQHATPVARKLYDGFPGRVLGGLATPVVRTYLGVRDRLGSVDPALSVRRHDGVPAETLAALYERSIPDRIHVRRSEAHYRWRFANPKWDRDPDATSPNTYVVRRNGDPVAGVVAVTTASPPPERTRILDAVPLVGGPGRSSALAAALDRIASDHAGAVHVEATADVLPDGVASGAGFVSDARFPFDRLAGRKPLLTVRTLRADGQWTLGGRSTDRIDNWLLAHGEIW